MLANVLGFFFFFRCRCLRFVVSFSSEAGFASVVFLFAFVFALRFSHHARNRVFLSTILGSKSSVEYSFALNTADFSFFCFLIPVLKIVQFSSFL